MKKMSEVFELPVDCNYFEVEGYQPVKTYSIDDRLEADEYAAHAINHVDALADVIENVLHHHGDALSYEIKSWCVDALAVYRGEK